MSGPCSAYCRPDEGIHSWVEYVTSLDIALAYEPGSLLIAHPKESACRPAGRHILLSVEPAPEAPPDPEPDPMYPVAVLFTTRCD